MLVFAGISPQTNIAAGTLGGILIAGSTTIALSTIGEWATMSGLFRALVHGREGALTGWRVSFVAGLLSAGAAAVALGSGASGEAGDAVRPIALLIAGALVGFGTSLGNGCTSGHGVCGLARFSPRSLVAVGSFMASGMATAVAVGAVPALRALVFDTAGHAAVAPSWGTTAAQSLAAAGAVVAAGWALFHLGLPPTRPLPAPEAPPATNAAAVPAAPAASGSPWARHAVSFAAGGLFGAGLLLSGMASPAKVLGFLNPFAPAGWDLTLAGVMGGAVLFNMAAFALMRASSGAPLIKPGSLPFKSLIAWGPADVRNSRIDSRLVVGSALFGAGWGLAGACPGPAVVAVGGGAAFATAFVPAMLLGMLAYDLSPYGEGLAILRKARDAPAAAGAKAAVATAGGKR